ncbi:MAG: hypothetical protein ACLU3N_04800, partial [Lachnospiraceae bacterium]
TDTFSVFTDTSFLPSQFPVAFSAFTDTFSVFTDTSLLPSQFPVTFSVLTDTFSVLTDTSLYMIAFFRFVAPHFSQYIRFPSFISTQTATISP